MTADKAADAFRTISEAAEDLDLPQHVLRFWETRFVQIKPLKRGGGRRYYRPDDVEFLRGLKHLLHAERYTIKGVQKIIKDQGVKAVHAAGKEAPATSPAPASTAADRPLHAPPVTPPAAMMSRQPPATSVRGKLESALGELVECRRLLSALRT